MSRACVSFRMYCCVPSRVQRGVSALGRQCVLCVAAVVWWCCSNCGPTSTRHRKTTRIGCAHMLRAKNSNPHCTCGVVCVRHTVTQCNEASYDVCDECMRGLLNYNIYVLCVSHSSSSCRRNGDTRSLMCSAPGCSSDCYCSKSHAVQDDVPRTHPRCGLHQTIFTIRIVLVI